MLLGLRLLLALSAGAPLDEERPDWLDDVESWAPGAEVESESATEDEGPRLPVTESGPTPEPSTPLEPQLDESVVGALRLVGAYLHFFDRPRGDDGLVATVARLIVRKDLSRRIDVELNLFAELSRTPGEALAGSFATASSFVSPYRAPQLTFEPWTHGTIRSQLGIDRARIGVRFERVGFDVGRFPINYAVTQIFTPNDFFAPFSATAINKSYKPGVDAVRVGTSLGELTSLELVGVITPEWADAAILARPSIVLWNFEWAAIGGKTAERWVVGGSLQGDAGPIGLRAEGHVGFPDLDGDGLDDPGDIHTRVSAGPNVNFEWQSTTIGAEYAYFSDGQVDPSLYIARFARRFPDDLPYLGRHYVGVVAGLETVPTLRLTATGLVNAGDGSGMAGLLGLLSVANEADLAFGAFVPWGRGPTRGPPPALRSEFGGQPLTIFVESRVFF